MEVKQFNNKVKISNSVDNVLADFNNNPQIYSYQLIEKFSEKHPEYGGGIMKNLKSLSSGLSKSKQEWVDEIIDLYDWDKISVDEKLKNELLLDGRKFIIGISLLDSELKEQLDSLGVFNKIVKELGMSLKNILSPKGLSLLNNVFDSVPNQSDEPVLDIEDDLLGRAAFARFLAQRMIGTEITSGAYSIHLCGSWGSGKTSIINFMKDELTGKSEKVTAKPEKNQKKQFLKWTVVDFNAWQNQYINPPWWPLYYQIYEESKMKLGFLYRRKEFLWRMLTGQPFQILVLIVVFWFIALIFNFADIDKTQTAATIAKNLSEIIALVTTVAGAVVAFGRSLLFNSAKAAQSFQEYSHDPMKAIQKRFGKLVKQLNKKSRLAVFIDDLDRCKSTYVVALLEGIQTLFRQGSVFFVVAADHKWLQTCFELVYSEFKDVVKEPGKPLGALFIEKTFQLTTPVPSIPNDFKAAYWNQLIMVKTDPIKGQVESAKEEARQELGKGMSDIDVNLIVEASKNQPMYRQLAIRQEAVIRLASPEIVSRTEHTLKPFISLCDDNPRAMKRLVNAYSVNRARAILSFLSISLEDLAQWTILYMRWPQLAEYLASNPYAIELIGNDSPDGVDPKLQFLFKNAEVIHVVNGGDITTAMTAEQLMICSKLL
ncbi:MAG: P-loop NTPase fold protein [Bacteroidales bacterium]